MHKPIHAISQEALNTRRIKRKAETLALEYIEMSGRLAAMVEWCVENKWERLGENPHQFAIAENILAEARALRDDAPTQKKD